MTLLDMKSARWMFLKDKNSEVRIFSLAFLACTSLMRDSQQGDVWEKAVKITGRFTFCRGLLKELSHLGPKTCFICTRPLEALAVAISTCLECFSSPHKRYRCRRAKKRRDACQFSSHYTYKYQMALPLDILKSTKVLQGGDATTALNCLCLE